MKGEDKYPRVQEFSFPVLSFSLDFGELLVVCICTWLTANLLLSVLNQILNFSRNILTDIPRNSVILASWGPLAQSN